MQFEFSKIQINTKKIETEYPTMRVMVPSKNKFYDEIEDKLTEWEIRQMTVKEQKKMLGMGVNHQDEVLTEIVKKCVVQPDVSNIDLLVQDRDFLLTQIRILTYGSEIEFETECPKCGQKNTVKVDLTTLPITYIDDPDIKISDNIIYTTDLIEYMGQPLKLKFKLQRTSSSKRTQQLLKMFKKQKDKEREILPYITIFSLLDEVNDEPIDVHGIKQIINIFLQLPQSEIQKLMKLQMTTQELGLKTTTVETCDTCGEEYEVSVLTSEFFLPVG